MKSITARQWLLAILLVALAGRLAFVIFFGHTLSLQASGYDVYAVNIMDGHGYTRFADFHPDSDLPPLYNYFLVAVYSTLGRSAINVALVQIVFDMVTIALIYAIGREAFPQKSPSIALTGAAFTAFYPYMLFQNLSTNDTALFMMLLAAAIWGSYKAFNDVAMIGDEAWSWQRLVRWPVFIGAILGAAALTKSFCLLLIPLLALWWWRRLNFRRAFVMGVALGLMALLMLVPWMIRNYRLHDEIVLISTNDGSNLLQGNNQCSAEFLGNGWDVQWSTWACFGGRLPDGLSEVEESAWYRDKAITWLRENPDAWARHFSQKFITLWNPRLTPYEVPPRELLDADETFVDDAVYLYETPIFQVARTVHVIYFAPLLVLAMIGWIIAAKDGQHIGPLLAVMVAITTAYLIFHPSTRYRMPADPFVFLLSAYSVFWLLARVKRWRAGSA